MSCRTLAKQGCSIDSGLSQSQYGASVYHVQPPPSSLQTRQALGLFLNRTKFGIVLRLGLARHRRVAA
ncbi:hypothetical protein IE53DRAFT_390456 [Violaceomyces palustris]|uniref:Uncharacterized protein n=1 Tax=Violaceomyces palustris TaxID=1673888 RepID=A0ACD0NNL7_9BASI|nr:hypothetical protein IE53DRAFT_390456 [Violaceomyces palustris]